MSKRVLVDTGDLFFRGKIQEIVRASGAEITRAEPYDLAVVELGKAGAQDRIRGLVERGVAVLAFGSHLNAEQLRDARTAVGTLGNLPWYGAHDRRSKTCRRPGARGRRRRPCGRA